jgi:hypothetical protein
VHYFAAAGTGEPWAAVITGVHADGSVALCAFPPGAAPLPIARVKLCGVGERRSGCCTWPPRVGTTD